MKVSPSDRSTSSLIEGQYMPSGSILNGQLPVAASTAYVYGPDDCFATDVKGIGNHLMFKQAKLCVITDQTVTLRVYQAGDGDSPGGSLRYWKRAEYVLTPASAGTAEAFFRTVDVDLRFVKYEITTSTTAPTTTSNSEQKFEFQRTLIPI